MINFLKYKQLYLLISLIVLVPGVFTLIGYGLRPSIDFVGGSVIEVAGVRDQGIGIRNKFEEKEVDIESKVARGIFGLWNKFSADALLWA